jgi:hypothetical protein
MYILQKTTNSVHIHAHQYLFYDYLIIGCNEITLISADYLIIGCNEITLISASIFLI